MWNIASSKDSKKTKDSSSLEDKPVEMDLMRPDSASFASSIQYHSHFCPSFYPENIQFPKAYYATVKTVLDLLLIKWTTTYEYYEKRNIKQAYYLSMEYLQGRALLNAIGNLELTGAYVEAMKKLGYSLEDVAGQEPDAALGNGGLGRLASCFMDSLATLNYPAWGHGLRYRYGLFKQFITKEGQEEVAESWLEMGNPEQPRFEVKKFNSLDAADLDFVSTGKLSGKENMPGELSVKIFQCLSRFYYAKFAILSKTYLAFVKSDYLFKERATAGHYEPSLYFYVFAHPSTYSWYTEAKTSEGWSCQLLRSMPEEREGAAVVGVGPHIYVMGGKRPWSRTLSDRTDTLYIFDGRKNTWDVGTPMTLARRGAACGAWNRSIYVFGGVGYDFIQSPHYAERYDIDHQVWEDVPIPGIRWDVTAGYFIVDSVIYTEMGLFHCASLDMRTGFWRVYSSLSEFPYNFKLTLNPMVEIGGSLYMHVRHDDIQVCPGPTITYILRGAELEQKERSAKERQLQNLGGNLIFVSITSIEELEVQYYLTCTEIQLRRDEEERQTGTIVRRNTHLDVRNPRRILHCLTLEF